MIARSSRRVFLVPPRRDLPGQLGGDPRSRTEALARAIATDPILADSGATLIVGSGPDPHIAILGSFDASVAARIEALPDHLDHVLPSLRYVDYRDVERDVEHLAAKLRQRLGALEDHRFRAIPRGGLIVLGMLAYALDLDASQLSDADDDRPLVLVDDVALTGARLRRFLVESGSKPFAFAHLYSHPDLRAAIETAESTLAVAAADLVDRAPERLGGRYEAWRAAWRARSDEDYWVGLVDQLCFPWAEPDISWWNDVGKRVEPGWRLLPPELVLKTRHGAAHTADVQIMERGTGHVRPTERALAADLGDEVVLVDVVGHGNLALSGSWAAMWRALVATGDLAAAADSVAEEYDAGSEQVLEDLHRLVDLLRGQELLEVTAESS